MTQVKLRNQLLGLENRGWLVNVYSPERTLPTQLADPSMGHTTHGGSFKRPTTEDYFNLSTFDKQGLHYLTERRPCFLALSKPCAELKLR